MSEEKTITLKKDTLWKFGFVVLAIALVVSIFTGGFGIKMAGSSGTGTQQQNTGATQQQGVTAADLTPFTSNPNLYPSLGSSSAKNTVIEFADFQCPYCAMASGLPNWTSQYATQYGDLIGAAGKVETEAQSGSSVRFIFVPMSFLGNESVYAAEAGYCAAAQGKFWEMHDAIYGASTSPSEDTGKYSKANLEILAQGINGLNQATFKNCLESDQYSSQVQTAGAQASTAAQGTPTFYVNGKEVTASSATIQAALQ